MIAAAMACIGAHAQENVFLHPDRFYKKFFPHMKVTRTPPDSLYIKLYPNYLSIGAHVLVPDVFVNITSRKTDEMLKFRTNIDDVIGFNVGPDEWRARLSGIAQGGGGSYFDAKDAAQLVDALQQAVALTYRVLDMQGAEVFQGQLGATATLPAGRYTVEIRGASPLTIADIAVGGATTAVELREEGNVLKGAVIAP